MSYEGGDEDKKEAVKRRREGRHGELRGGVRGEGEGSGGKRREEEGGGRRRMAEEDCGGGGEEKGG